MTPQLSVILIFRVIMLELAMMPAIVHNKAVAKMKDRLFELLTAARHSLALIIAHNSPEWRIIDDFHEIIDVYWGT